MAAPAMNEMPAGRSPVEAIPVEILSDILTKSVHIEWDQRTLINGRKYPLNIAQVCRRWRDVALSTPSLWGLICLTGPHFRSEVYSDAIELLSMSTLSTRYLICTTRVWSNPGLRNKTFSSYDSHNFGVLCDQGKLDVFQDQSLGVDIDTAFCDSYERISAWLHGFRRLQRLRIVPTVGDYPISSMPSHFPHLTHLHLFMNRHDQVDAIMKTKWVGLVSLILEVDGVPFSWDVPLIVSNFPDLKELLLDVLSLQLISSSVPSTLHSSTTSSAYTHPKLKFLGVGLPRLAQPTFLETINLPALQELAINTWEPQYADHHFIEDFISRSKCKLHFLEVIAVAHMSSWEREWGRNAELDEALKDVFKVFGVDRVDFARYLDETDMWARSMVSWYSPHITFARDKDMFHQVLVSD